MTTQIKPSDATPVVPDTPERSRLTAIGHLLIAVGAAGLTVQTQLQQAYPGAHWLPGFFLLIGALVRLFQSATEQKQVQPVNYSAGPTP